MSVSAWDDYPVHQAPEFIAHPATSDRNFYDRYYFNMHPCSDAWSAIFGFGTYPNLGVVDAFVDVRRGDRQHIVRASAPLVDRRDTSVGPISVEVIEPLHRLRVVVEATEHPVSMDVVWEGHTPAIAEPRQYLRSKGKVIFDTQRLAQTGTWSGTLRVAGEEIPVEPRHCHGVRDRSWGVRPVGEPEPDGIRQGELVLSGMWNYFPMQFDDHAIFYICHERDDGDRPLVQGQRVWSDPDRPIEELGRSEHDHRFEPGTRVLTGSTITFPEAGVEIECAPLLANFISVGTGYGIDADWRHGLYHGPEPVTQGLVLDVAETRGLAQYGIVDQVAKFSYAGHVGYGLYEHGFFGPFRRYGMTDGAMGAPA
ncbi:MAG TPA: hypothetical protein VKG43_12845 [Acidimicrobiales bacterium]|nr:hypothetical protein [Acidimicrobiales bacterium]